MASITDLEGLIARHRLSVENYNKQIAQLESVYTALGELKSSFRSAKKSTSDIFNEKITWRGEKYTTFCSNGDSLDYSLEDYYKRIDTAQDTVNTKIGELKAKKWALIPLISNLVGQIEQLKAEVENILN